MRACVCVCGGRGTPQDHVHASIDILTTSVRPDVPINVFTPRKLSGIYAALTVPPRPAMLLIYILCGEEKIVAYVHSNKSLLNVMTDTD